MCNFRHERVVWVRIREHRADGEEDFRNGKGRRPLVPQNVEADAAIGIDIGMVDSGCEVDLRRLEWVVGRKVYSEKKDAPSIW